MLSVLGLSLLNPIMPGEIRIDSAPDVLTSAITPLPGEGSCPSLLVVSASLDASST